MVDSPGSITARLLSAGRPVESEGLHPGNGHVEFQIWWFHRGAGCHQQVHAGVSDSSSSPPADLQDCCCLPFFSFSLDSVDMQSLCFPEYFGFAPFFAAIPKKTKQTKKHCLKWHKRWKFFFIIFVWEKWVEMLSHLKYGIWISTISPLSTDINHVDSVSLFFAPLPGWCRWGRSSVAASQRSCRSPSNGKVSTTSNTITGRSSGRKALELSNSWQDAERRQAGRVHL